MPQYELVLIVRSLPRPQLVQVVRRCCEQIWSSGGVIRSMDHLGHKELPYKMQAKGKSYSEGNYFLLDFHTQTDETNALRDSLHQDEEILRPSIIKKEEEFVRLCDSGPCQFGEISNPDYERKTWRRRAIKKLWKLRDG